MTKARIDWMESGKVKVPGIRITKLSRTADVRISNGSGSVPAGELEPSASNGAHVAEFALFVDGASYTAVYYNSAAANNYAVAYYNAAGALIGGIQGGNPVGASTIKTETVTPPTGTRTVRVFCINRETSQTYNKEASLTPTQNGGVYSVSEIRVKPTGASASQLVWPTTSYWRIVANTAQVRYSRYSEIYADGSNYAYITATVEEVRGQTVIQTVQNQRFEIDALWRVDDITIEGQTVPAFYIDTYSGHQIVRGRDLKTTPTNRLSARVRGIWNGLQTGTLYINQESNSQGSPTYSYGNYNAYRIELSETDIVHTGGTVTLYGYKQRPYTVTYTWTSGATASGQGGIDETLQSPDSITVTPNTGVTISGNQITFPANTGTDEIAYDVTAIWSRKSDSATVYVYGTDTGRTYGTPTITNYAYPNKYGLGAGIIPASGGNMYPRVDVSLPCTVNGSNYTLTGYTTTGETAVTVSYGSISTTVYLEYRDAPNGYVEADSRGTNEDTGNTVVASNLRVRVSKGSNQSQSNVTPTVYQQRNQKTLVQAGSFNVSAMTLSLKADGATLGNNPTINAVETDIQIEVRVTGSGTTSLYSYTSGDTSGGDSISLINDLVNASLSVTSGGSPVTVTNQQFTASNQHNLTDKSYSISATYEGTSRSQTLTQKKDKKIDGSATPYVSLTEISGSNSLWAGGGTVDLLGTAYSVAGKVWESDLTRVAGESSTTDNTNILILELFMSTDGAYTASVVGTNTTNHTKTFRIQHRDMQTSVTTDSLTIVAKNGSTQIETPLTYSVQNSLEGTIYQTEGEISWGSPYTGKRNYAVDLAIGNYTSQENAAPFAGATVPYSVAAYHKEAQLHDGVVPIYTVKHYSSWSADHNDANHYAIQSTTYDSTTYAGQLVPGSSWQLVLGDNYSFTSVPSWCTFSGGTLTIAAQSSGAAARHGTVIVQNTSAPQGQSVLDSETIYQKKFVSLSVSPDSLNMLPAASSATVVITSVNTMFNVTWTPTMGDAGTTITPNSNLGNSSTTMETSVVVAVTQNTGYTVKYGVVTVTSIDDPSVSIEIQLMQLTQYTASGLAEAWWTSDTGIGYRWSLTNHTAGSRSYNITVVIRSTPSGQPITSPSARDELTISRTITLAGGATGGEENMTAALVKDSSRDYYSNIIGAEINSSYREFIEVRP